MRKHKLLCVLLITMLFTGLSGSRAMGQNEAAYDSVVIFSPGNARITVIDHQVSSDKTLDAAPVIQEGFTLVPVKGVLDALGATARWIPESRQVEISTADTRILLTLDSNLALVNNLSINMDKPAQIINGRTLIPLRFVAENLGYVVKWNAEEQKAAIINKTVATADGIVIGYGEYNQAMAWTKYYVEKQYGSEMWNEIAQNGKTWTEVFPEMVLEELIAGEIVEATAKAQNTQVSEAEINSGLEEVRNLIKQDPELAKVVKQANIGPRFLRSMVSEKLYGTKYKANYVKNIQISENEIQQYYQQNQSAFTKEQVKASHILIKINGNDQEAYQKASDILKRVQAGEDFAKLAREFSEDPGSAAKGGDLGYFGKGVMVEAFEQAAFSLNKGQVSDLVKTPYGYHIIKAEDHTKEIIAYDKVKEAIKKVLLEKKLQEHIDTLVNQRQVKIYG